MSKYDEIKTELQEIIKEGEKLYAALEFVGNKQINDLHYFVLNYEAWYSKAFLAVKQLQPDRLDDFKKLYEDKTRKSLDIATYCISDALRTIQHNRNYYGPWTAALCVLRQVNIVEACLDALDSKLRDIRTILQADVFDSEIDTAKHLLYLGYIRAAGAICGVILEKHFATVCTKRGIIMEKKNPTISEYNNILKDIAYDIIEWRRIQRLGDIRNLCDHNKNREPTKDEVSELISGTEKTIKTVS